MCDNVENSSRVDGENPQTMDEVSFDTLRVFPSTASLCNIFALLAKKNLYESVARHMSTGYCKLSVDNVLCLFELSDSHGDTHDFSRMLKPFFGSRWLLGLVNSVRSGCVFWKTRTSGVSVNILIHKPLTDMKRVCPSETYRHNAVKMFLAADSSRHGG